MTVNYSNVFGSDELALKRHQSHKKRGILCAYLHGHNGDDLYLDSVELVEAAPAARLHQPREDPTDGLVVLPVRTVDHHHVLRQVLAQVLNGRESKGGGYSSKRTQQASTTNLAVAHYRYGTICHVCACPGFHKTQGDTTRCL